MSNRNMNLIIEGLNNRKLVNESTKTSFMPKIEKFLGKIDKEEAEFVKKVINTLYEKIEKEYGTFFESKTIYTRKDKLYDGVKYITWKIQLNTPSEKAEEMGIYKEFDRFLSGFKCVPFIEEIGNVTYRGISKTFDNEDEFTHWHKANGFAPNRFTPEEYVFVGIDKIMFNNQKPNPKGEGTAFQFVIARPVDENGK